MSETNEDSMDMGRATHVLENQCFLTLEDAKNLIDGQELQKRQMNVSEYNPCLITTHEALRIASEKNDEIELAKKMIVRRKKT